MNLYKGYRMVNYGHNESPEPELIGATPGEALQYALRCDTCKGSGLKIGDRAGGMYPCSQCVDGIPRWGRSHVSW